MTYYKEEGQNAIVYVSENKPIENQDGFLHKKNWQMKLCQ